VRKLIALIARCHQMLGDLPAALNACSEGLRLDPDDAELHFRKAVLHRKAGQPAEAEACWRRILTLKRPDQFCCVDQGTYGHLTLRNLAVLAEERGDRAEAQRLWRMVLERLPRRPRGHGARRSGTVNQGACRQAAPARRPQVRPERSQETPQIPVRQ
jgi:tetratricopeptide (TPR) repeat protein